MDLCHNTVVEEDHPHESNHKAGWQYLQMVKMRDERGKFLGTKLRVIFGTKAEVWNSWAKARLTSNAAI
jgi:hypothetical protein